MSMGEKSVGEKFLGEKCVDEKVHGHHGRRKVYGGKSEGKKHIVEESLGGKSGGESIWLNSLWVKRIWVKDHG